LFLLASKRYNHAIVRVCYFSHVLSILLLEDSEASIWLGDLDLGFSTFTHNFLQKAGFCID
jgi:hypothetical protein